MSADPWDTYLDPAASALPARVVLELDGEDVEIVVTDPVARRVALPPDVAVFGSDELELLRRASPDGPIPPEVTKALVRVKSILGGEVVGAKATNE